MKQLLKEFWKPDAKGHESAECDEIEERKQPCHGIIGEHGKHGAEGFGCGSHGSIHCNREKENAVQERYQRENLEGDPPSAQEPRQQWHPVESDALPDISSPVNPKGKTLLLRREPSRGK